MDSSKWNFHKIDISDKVVVVTGASMGIGEAMPGLDIRTLPETELMATRGW